MRLERGVLTWREGPGALTQQRRCWGSFPLPHPPGCPLKPGGGFDLGSTGLSAGPARWNGGGAEDPTSPEALPSPGPLHPPPGHGDCFRLFQGAPESRPHPCFAAVPQLPCPTPKTAGREAGGGEQGAAARLGLGPGRAGT